MSIISNHAKKVLVVDDDPAILAVIEVILQDEGYQVVTTERGEDVEQLRPDNLPDLILLDMLLSGKDGRWIARMLKSQSLTRAIPLLMLSAHPGAQADARACGANAFLAKPFEIDTLIETVARLLRA
jgi:CheY-like chemotaxis protein